MEGQLAVAGAVVYVVRSSPDSSLNAFDLAGSAGCTGSPAVCQPMWTGPAGPVTDRGGPSVVNGVVLVASSAGLVLFDGAGATNCSGPAPRVCTPLDTIIVGALQPAVSISTGIVFTISVGRVVTAWRVD
jgi:hypothetical protein